MKRKRSVILVIALVVLCVLIGFGIALWYLFGSNPNDGGGNGDDTTTVTPGDPDDEPGTGGNPDDEPGTPGDPDDEPGTGGNPDDEPGTPGDPDDEPGTGGNPDDEPGTGGNPDDEPGTGGNPDDEPGTGGNPDDEPETPHEHTYTSAVTKEPTCTQEGEMTYTCTCGESYTEPIAMTAHTEVIDKAVAPTCTATGLTEGKHCSVCGTVLVKQEVVSMIAHNYVGEVTKKPTCEQEGEMTYTCSGCGGSYTEIIPMTAHTEVIDEAVAPTCTATGLTEGKHCSVCGEILVEQQVIAMIAHNYSDEWTSDDEDHWHVCTECGARADIAAHIPDRDQPGENTPVKCTVCEYIIKPATGHIVHTAGDKWFSDGINHWQICTGCGIKMNESAHSGGLATCISKAQCAVCNAQYGELAAHSPETIPAVAPTCTKTGLTEGQKCSVCGTVLVEQEVVSMIAHNYVGEVTKKPTCEREGEMTYTCTGCGGSYTESIPMTAHTEVIDAAVAPTCTQTGLTEGKHCSVCGTVLVKQEVIPMTAHTEVIDAAVAPTCTKTGLTEGKHCSVCGTVLVKQEVIPMTEHTEVIDEAVAPSCTQTGLTEGKHCSVCGTVLVEQEVVPMIPHTEVIDAAVKPTCTQTGLTEGKHCSVCNTVLVKQEVIPMTEHSYTSKVTKQPTCTEEGVRTYTCSGCGNSYTEKITANGHTIVIDKAVAPTCTKTGLTEGKHCSVCGTVLVKQEVIPMTEHSYTSKVTKQPTCTEEGVRTYTCSGCGNSYTEKISANGHTIVIDKAVAPTCIKTGLTEGKHCSVCGEVLVEQETLPTIDHNYVNGVCTMCGKPDESYATNGLVFTISNDGTYYSVTDYTGTATEVYIPSAYEGLPVTRIGGSAFQFCSNLTGITIPNSVTSIGEFAFSGCSRLTSITIPDSVTSIGRYAFSNCSSLTSITIPKGVTSIGERAFDSCSSLENIAVASSNSVYHSAENCIIETESKTLIVGCSNSVIPSDGSVTNIGDSAFSGCSSLTSITIPDSVTSIGDSAFFGCSSLKSVTIPDGVTSIGDYVFNGCDSLTSITIPDSVTSIGRGVFSGCSSLTSITIPDSVTSIGVSAFGGCSSLTSITIPSSVTSIGDEAFWDCSSLTSITIPDSVTSIGRYAFFGCYSLTSVTFENPNGWRRSTSSTATSGTSISRTYLSNPSTAATYLTSTYCSYYWKKS